MHALRPLSPILVSALLSTAALAQSPLVVTDATRTLYAQAFGFDYEFNDGTSVQDQNVLLAGAWTRSAAAELSDYYGTEVGAGAIDHDSEISTTALSFDLVCTASTTGSLFQSDALAETAYEVDFTLTRDARITFDAMVSADVGYNLAHVSVESADGSITVLDVSADYGGVDDDAESFGIWLPAGDYVVRAGVEAQAYGSSGQPSQSIAAASLALEIHEAVDFDCDGQTTRRDLDLFRAFWKRGYAAADFDGNGVVDRADHRAFRAAWSAQR